MKLSRRLRKVSESNGMLKKFFRSSGKLKNSRILFNNLEKYEIV